MSNMRQRDQKRKDNHNCICQANASNHQEESRESGNHHCLYQMPHISNKITDIWIVAAYAQMPHCKNISIVISLVQMLHVR